MSNEQKNAFGNQDSALDQNMQPNAPTSTVIEDDDEEEENKQSKPLGPTFGAATPITSTPAASSESNVPLATSESYTTDELDSDDAAKEAAAGDVLAGIQRTSDAVKYDSTGSAADIYRQTLGITDYDSLRRQVGLKEGESFTDYYNRGGYIPAGWETQAKLLLAEERRKKSYSEYLAGDVSKEDFLMKAYGEDILKADGINRKSVKYWRNNYEKNGYFDDPLDNPIFVEQIITQANNQFEAEAWAETVASKTLEDTPLNYTATKLTGTKLNSATFEQLFSGTETWDSLMDYFKSSDKIFTYFRAGYIDANTINPLIDVNGDGNYDYYLHLDGVLYAVDSETSVGEGTKKAKLFFDTVGATDAESTLDRVRVDGMLGNNAVAEFTDSFLDGLSGVWTSIVDIIGYGVQGLWAAFDSETTFADANTWWEAQKNSNGVVGSLFGESNTRTFSDFTWGEGDDIARGIASGVGMTTAIVAEIALHAVLAASTGGAGNAAVIAGKTAGKAVQESAEAATKAAVKKSVGKTIGTGIKKTLSKALQLSTGLRSGMWSNVAIKTADELRENAVKKLGAEATEAAIKKQVTKKLSQNYFNRFIGQNLGSAAYLSITDGIQSYAYLSSQNEVLKATQGEEAGYSGAELFGRAALHTGISFVASSVLRSVGESNILTRGAAIQKIRGSANATAAAQAKFTPKAMKLFTLAQRKSGLRVSAIADVLENAITMTNNAYFGSISNIDTGIEGWAQSFISTAFSPEVLMLNLGIYNEGVHGDRFNLFGVLDHKNKHRTDPYRGTLANVENLETTTSRFVELLHKTQADIGVKSPEIKAALEKLEADFYDAYNKTEITIKNADGTEETVRDAIAIKLNALGKANDLLKQIGFTFDSKENKMSDALTKLLKESIETQYPGKTEEEYNAILDKVSKQLTNDNNTIVGAIVALQDFMNVSKYVLDEVQFAVDCYRDAVKADADVSGLIFTTGGFEWVDVDKTLNTLPTKYQNTRFKYAAQRKTYEAMSKTIGSVISGMNNTYNMEFQTYLRNTNAAFMLPDWKPNEAFNKLLGESLQLRNLLELTTEGGDKTFEAYRKNPEAYPELRNFLQRLDEQGEYAGIQLITVDTDKWNNDTIKGGEGSEEYKAFIRACQTLTKLNSDAICIDYIEGKPIILLNPMGMDINIYKGQAELGAFIHSLMSLQLAPINSTEWVRALELMTCYMYQDRSHYSDSDSVKYISKLMSFKENRTPEVENKLQALIDIYAKVTDDTSLTLESSAADILRKANKALTKIDVKEGDADAEALRLSLGTAIGELKDARINLTLEPITDEIRKTAEYKKAINEVLAIFTYFDTTSEHASIRHSTNSQLKHTEGLIPFSMLYYAHKKGTLNSLIDFNELELPGGSGEFKSAVTAYMDTMSSIEKISDIFETLHKANSHEEQAKLVRDMASSDKQEVAKLYKLLQDSPEYFYLCWNNSKTEDNAVSKVKGLYKDINFLTASESGVKDFLVERGISHMRKILEYSGDLTDIAGNKQSPISIDSFTKTIVDMYISSIDSSNIDRTVLEKDLVELLNIASTPYRDGSIKIDASTNNIVKLDLSTLQSAEVTKLTQSATTASKVSNVNTDEEKTLSGITSDKSIDKSYAQRHAQSLANWREQHANTMNVAFNLDIESQRKEFCDLMVSIGYNRHEVNSWVKNSDIPDTIPGIHFTSKGAHHSISIPLSKDSFETFVSMLDSNSSNYTYKKLDGLQKIDDAVIMLEQAAEGRIYLDNNSVLGSNKDTPLLYSVGTDDVEWAYDSITRTIVVTLKQGKPASAFKDGADFNLNLLSWSPTHKTTDAAADNAIKAIKLSRYFAEYHKKIQSGDKAYIQQSLTVPKDVVTEDMLKLFNIAHETDTTVSLVLRAAEQDEDMGQALLNVITSDGDVDFSKIFPFLSDTELVRGTASENFTGWKIKLTKDSDMSEASLMVFNYMMDRFIQDGLGDANDFMNLMQVQLLDIGDYSIDSTKRVVWSDNITVKEALSKLKDSKNIYDVMLRSMIKDHISNEDIPNSALYNPRTRQAIAIAINLASCEVDNAGIYHAREFKSNPERFKALLDDVDSIVTEANNQLNRYYNLPGDNLYHLGVDNKITEIRKQDVIEALNLLISKNPYTDYTIEGDNKLLVEHNAYAKLASVVEKGPDGELRISLSNALTLDKEDIDVLSHYISGETLKKLFRGEDALLKKFGWEEISAEDTYLPTIRRLLHEMSTVAVQQDYIGLSKDARILIENNLNALRNKKSKLKVKASDLYDMAKEGSLADMWATLLNKHTLLSVEHPGSLMVYNFRNSVACQRMFYEIYETANSLKATLQSDINDDALLSDEALSKLAMHIALGTTGTQNTSVFDSYYAIVKHQNGTVDVRPFAQNQISGDDGISLWRNLTKGTNDNPGILTEASTDEVLLFHANKNALIEGRSLASGITTIDLRDNSNKVELVNMLSRQALNWVAKSDFKDLFNGIPDTTVKQKTLLFQAINLYLASKESQKDLYDAWIYEFEQVAPSDEIRELMNAVARSALPTIKSLASGKEGNSLQQEAFKEYIKSIQGNLDLLVSDTGSPLFSRLTNEQVQETIDAMIFSVNLASLPRNLRNILSSLNINDILKDKVSIRVSKAESNVVEAIRKGTSSDIEEAMRILEAEIAADNAYKIKKDKREELNIWFKDSAEDLKQQATNYYNRYGYSKLTEFDNKDVFIYSKISEATEETRNLIALKLDDLSENEHYNAKGGLYERLNKLAESDTNPFYIEDAERAEIDAMSEAEKEYHRTFIKAFHGSANADERASLSTNDLKKVLSVQRSNLETEYNSRKDSLGNSITIDPIKNITIPEDTIARILYKMSLADMTGKDIQAIILGLSGKDILNNTAYDIKGFEDTPLYKLTTDDGFVKIDVEAFFQPGTNKHQLPYEIAIKKFKTSIEGGKYVIKEEGESLVIYLDRGEVTIDETARSVNKSVSLDIEGDWKVISSESLKHYNSLRSQNISEETDTSTNTKYMMLSTKDSSDLAASLLKLLQSYCDVDTNGTITKLPIATYNGDSYDIPVLTKLLMPGLNDDFTPLSEIKPAEFFNNRTVDIYSILRNSNFDIPELNNMAQRRFSMDTLVDILKLKRDTDSGEQHDALVDLTYQARLLEKMLNSSTDINKLSKGLTNSMLETLKLFGYDETAAQKFISDNIDFSTIRSAITDSLNEADMKFIFSYMDQYEHAKGLGSTPADQRLKRFLNILNDIEYRREHSYQRAKHRAMLEIMERYNSKYIDFIENGGRTKMNLVMQEVFNHVGSKDGTPLDLSDKTNSGLVDSAMWQVSEALRIASGDKIFDASYDSNKLQAFFETNTVEECTSKILNALKDLKDSVYIDKSNNSGTSIWNHLLENEEQFVRLYDDTGTLLATTDSIYDDIEKRRINSIITSKEQFLKDSFLIDDMFDGDEDGLQDLILGSLFTIYGEVWGDHDSSILKGSSFENTKKKHLIQESAHTKVLDESINQWGDACLTKRGLYSLIGGIQPNNTLDVYHYTDTLGKPEIKKESPKRGVIYMSPAKFKQFYGVDYQTAKNSMGLSADQPLYGRLIRHPGATEEPLHLYEIAITRTCTLAVTADEFFNNHNGDFDGDHIIFERLSSDVQKLGEMRKKHLGAADDLATGITRLILSADKDAGVSHDILNSVRTFLDTNKILTTKRTFKTPEEAQEYVNTWNEALSKELPANVDKTKFLKKYGFIVESPVLAEQTASSDKNYMIYSPLITHFHPEDYTNSSALSYKTRQDIIYAKTQGLIDSSTGALDKLKLYNTTLATADDAVSNTAMYRSIAFDLSKETSSAFKDAWNSATADDKGGFKEKLSDELSRKFGVNTSKFMSMQAEDALNVVLHLLRAEYSVNQKSYTDEFTKYLKTTPDVFKSTRDELEQKLKLWALKASVQGIKNSDEVNLALGDLSNLNLMELRNLEHKIVSEIYTDGRKEAFYESDDYGLGSKLVYEIAKDTYKGIAPFTKFYGALSEWNTADPNSTAYGSYVTKKILIAEDSGIAPDTFAYRKGALDDVTAVHMYHEKVDSKFTDDFKQQIQEFIETKNASGKSFVIPKGLKVYEGDNSDYSGIVIKAIVNNKEVITDIDDLDYATHIIFEERQNGANRLNNIKLCIPGSNVGKTTRSMEISGISDVLAKICDEHNIDLVMGEFEISKFTGIPNIKQLSTITVNGKSYLQYEVPIAISETDAFYKHPVKERVLDTITTVNSAHSPEGLLSVGGMYLDISNNDISFNSSRLTELQSMIKHMNSPNILLYNGARNYNTLRYLELLKGITSLDSKTKRDLLTSFCKQTDAGGSGGYIKIGELISKYYSSEDGKKALDKVLNKNDMNKYLFSQELHDSFVASMDISRVASEEQARSKLKFPKKLKGLEDEVILSMNAKASGLAFTEDAYMRSNGRQDTTSGYMSNFSFLNGLLKAGKQSKISNSIARQGTQTGALNLVNMVPGNYENGFKPIAMSDSVQVRMPQPGTQTIKVGASREAAQISAIVEGAHRYGIIDDVPLAEGIYGKQNTTNTSKNILKTYKPDGQPEHSLGYKNLDIRNKLIQSCKPSESRYDLANRLSGKYYDDTITVNYAPASTKISGGNIVYSSVPIQSEVTLKDYAKHVGSYTGSPGFFDRQSQRYNSLLDVDHNRSILANDAVGAEVYSKYQELKKKYLGYNSSGYDEEQAKFKALMEDTSNTLEEQAKLRAEGREALREAKGSIAETDAEYYDIAENKYSFIYDTPFKTKKSLLSSSGIKTDTTEGVATDRFLQQYRMKRNISYQTQFGTRLESLKQAASNLMSLGISRDAYNINKYIAYKSILSKIEFWETNNINKSTKKGYIKYPATDPGMQMDAESKRHVDLFTEKLGVPVKEAQEYIRNFESTNATAIFVRELNELTRDFYIMQRKINNKTGGCFPDNFWLISTVISGDKDLDRANFNAAFGRLMRNPFGYDKNPITLFKDYQGYTESTQKQFSQEIPHGWEDIEFFKTFETRAKEICSVKAIVDLSQQLKSTGAMANARVQKILSDESILEVFKTAELLGTRSNDSVTDMHYANYLMLATSIANTLNVPGIHVNTKDSVPLGKRYYELFTALKKYTTDKNLTMHEAIELSKNNASEQKEYQNIIFAYNSLADVAAQLCMIDTKNETTSNFLDHIYKQFISENKDYAIVDQFGREITKDLKDFRALSANSFEDLVYIGKKASKFEGTFEQQVALELIMGDVYIMDKTLAGVMKDQVFTKRNPRIVQKFINAVRNFTMKYIMANPMKAIGRFLNFSNFDVINNMMVSPSSALYLRQAGREVSTYFASKGNAASPELEEFIRITAMSPNSGVYQGEAFTSKSRGPLKGYFNTMTDIFNMQSMFTRYALWLDLKNAQAKDKNHGEIPAWKMGSSYRYKDKMSGIKGDAEAGITAEGAKAMFVISNQYGSPGDMPYIASKLSEKGFMFVTFPFALTRFAKDSTLSAASAFKDIFSSETRSSALKYLGYNIGSSAVMMAVVIGLYQMLLGQVLDDEDQDDEETLKEFLSNGYGIDPFQSILQDELIPNQGAQIHPWQALASMTINPVLEGMDNAENIGLDEGNLAAGLLNWVDTQAISKFNPAITVPLNSLSNPIDEDKDGKADVNGVGGYLSLLDSQGIKYSDGYNSFLDNLSREVSGIMIGSTAANTFTDSMIATSESEGILNRLSTSMSKALAAEMGNTKSYKNNKKNYSRALKLIKAYQQEKDLENLKNRVPKTEDERIRDMLYEHENEKTQEEANELYNKLSKAKNTEASIEAISTIIDKARSQGVNEYQIKSALKAVSIRLKLEDMGDNVNDFLDSLSESEYNSIIIALAYEDAMFPIFNEEYDAINLAEELAKKQSKTKEDSTLWYSALENYGNLYSYDSNYRYRPYPVRTQNFYNNSWNSRDRDYHRNNYYSNNYTPVSTYNYLVNKLK